MKPKLVDTLELMVFIDNGGSSMDQHMGLVQTLVSKMDDDAISLLGAQHGARHGALGPFDRTVPVRPNFRRLAGEVLGPRILERSLAGAGYRVISGDALYRLEGSTSPRLSTYVAAQQLGADAVFVINSLETSDVQRGARF